MVSEKALLPHNSKYSRASRCHIEQYGGLKKEIPPQIFLLKNIWHCLLLYQTDLTKNKKNWKLLQGASDKPEIMQYTVKNCNSFLCKAHIAIFWGFNPTKNIIWGIVKAFEPNFNQTKAPTSTKIVYRVLFLKSMILYDEVVAKNEINAKMKMSQNLHNLTTICVYVWFLWRLSQTMHMQSLALLRCLFG